MTTSTMKDHADPMMPYCATIKRDGFTPLLFGTVFLPPKATVTEIETALLTAMVDHGLDGFTIQQIRGGALIWVPRDE